MPKILVKGGIWKNTEDEILKVAVMKYGKNQWSRIASLLHKKSSKQCKARWYEWIDPSIKKTEWSREEDEKLLHLAKLMPTQWRTIAPIVGRTSSQCIERYEFLLDQAQIQESGAPPSEDPRKLRVGEIDPNPESKPARPDPIDMDEDELEMLSEARARLANTQGKKAKRKAREKQLDEARRLATIQKKRELKAAGIDFIIFKKRKRVIDYNEEIPLEKAPALGFYDTSHETIDPHSEEFKELRMKEYTRRDRIEILERRKEKENQKQLKEADIKNLIQKSNIRQRSKLILPEPQINDTELQEVIKLGLESSAVKSSLLNDGDDENPTKTLVGNYSINVGNDGGLRTPRTPANPDYVMIEAKNLLALNSVETPLKGGTNVVVDESALKFSESQNKQTPMKTPNTLLMSPYTKAGPNIPVGNQVPASPRLKTPIRDTLSINRNEMGFPMESPAGTPVSMTSEMDPTEIQMRLKYSLSKLPKPSDDYNIVVPSVESEPRTAEPLEEDSGEIDERIKEKEMKERLEFELLIPAAQRRNLPIPTEVSALTAKTSNTQSSSQPEELIKQEMTLLIDYSLRQDVHSKSRKFFKSKKSGNLQVDTNDGFIKEFSSDMLKEARELIDCEVSEYLSENNLTIPSDSLFCNIWEDCFKDIMLIHSEKRFSRSTLANQQEKIENQSKIFEVYRNHMADLAKTAAKVENKLKILHGGYFNRSLTLTNQINNVIDEIESAQLDLDAFNCLQKQESKSAPIRLQEARERLEKCKQEEQDLQQLYLQLLYKRNYLSGKNK